ncbi:MAG: P-loop NTPase fold protein [Pseudomonadota bacterium]
MFAAWWKAINYDAIAVFADEHFAEVVERLAEHDEAFWAPKTQEGATDTDAALGAVSKVFDEAGVDKNFPVKIVQSRQCEDNPTNEDLLRRRPFARALVKAIKEIQAQKRENSSKGHQRKKHENGFAVHLHAPWGAGKSSVLLMMEEYFQSDSKGKVDPADDWVVVHFNAWEHERRNPPWWPLVKAMYDGVAQKLSGSTPLEAGASACSLRRTFVLWKLIPNWLPLGASILVVGLLVVFGFGGGGSGDGDWAETAGRLLRLATSGGAVYGVILVASQALVFGSGENAKFYSGLLQDPLHRIQKLFKAIVGGAGRPIVVMIDDLDRCSATYVVDLLEGVQTAFRDARVVYVVAADRDWIRSSFRQRYEKFKEDVGTPEQPVGYLFLEKIFQLSTPLPGMSADSRKKLLREVTGVGEAQLEPPTEAEIAKEKERLVAKGGFTFDRSGAEGDEAPTQKSEAARAAEVELATSASDEAEAARRHILQDFEDLLPDVPRVMKRVNNAFGFRLGIARLEGADVDERPLARWTILEQRYPLAAGVLADRPDWAGDIGKPLDEGMERKKRKALEPFEGVAAIVAIIGEGEEDALTKEVIEEIVRGGRV